MTRSASPAVMSPTVLPWCAYHWLTQLEHLLLLRRARRLEERALQSMTMPTSLTCATLTHDARLTHRPLHRLHRLREQCLCLSVASDARAAKRMVPRLQQCHRVEWLETRVAREHAPE